MNKAPAPLSFRMKLLYGSGEWGISSLGMLRSVFFALYLTDVVGLDPRLASFGALAGVIWDAINDPLIGRLSDRLQTRWGRRRPFLLWFSVPFGAAFVLLWTAPQWPSDIARLAYVTAAFMITDTLSTLVAVPFLSLTPELAPSYDERTTLTSFRNIFQLLAALTVVVAAPLIIDAVLEAGGTQQQGFMLTGALFGATGIVPLFLIGLKVRERSTPEERRALPVREALRAAWRNVPFRFAVGMHMLNWSAVDLMAVAFPYFLLYWIGEGDLLSRINVLGIELSLESGFFGVLMTACIACVPFWLWMAHRRDKRQAYMLGMGAWVIVQGLIFLLQPGEPGQLLALAALAGIGVSAAYVLPDAIFPDVIEWDELRTGRRQEGIYYGARAFIRKLSGALVIFVTLQLLGWSGYQAPPVAALQHAQSEATLTMIRYLVSPLGAVLLAGVIVLAWHYPLSRAEHARIQRLLERRRRRAD